jgi:hypothetical protein
VLSLFWNLLEAEVLPSSWTLGALFCYFWLFGLTDPSLCREIAVVSMVGVTIGFIFATERLLPGVSVTRVETVDDLFVSRGNSVNCIPIVMIGIYLSSRCQVPPLFASYAHLANGRRHLGSVFIYDERRRA